MIKKIIIMSVLLGLVGAIAAPHFRLGDEQTITFRTAQVTRGDLLVSISATGTVEPEEVIDVGAQVAGQILSFGKDIDGKAVDYGSVVEEGMVLAEIDDSLYAAQAAEAAARVQHAKAGLQRAEAELEQKNAAIHQAERDWLRAEKLRTSNSLPEADCDAYRSAYDIARANVAVGKATILEAKALIVQAEAARQRTEQNLDYCTIKSPVKGVIIDRRVNIGQTVVASLNAPSLFLLAKDLTRMQVWVAVNEADVGNIRSAQPVTFTVDAFAGEVFRGDVRKTRLNASMTQNVVTYTVEVVTDNSNGRLLPYLTANVQFGLDRRKDVLLVPNAALRWTPSRQQVSPEFRETPDNGDVTNQGVVWSPHGQQVRPVRVRVGITDGITTEVEGEGLTEGLAIVTGLHTPARGKTNITNPFAPKIPPPPGSGGPPLR